MGILTVLMLFPLALSTKATATACPAS